MKGTGKRVTIERIPNDAKLHWAERGSYRLETMLATLSNIKNPFSMEDYTLYILDDYSVHLKDEVKDALLKKRYILVHIERWSNGDVHIKDTQVHHHQGRYMLSRERLTVYTQVSSGTVYVV